MGIVRRSLIHQHFAVASNHGQQIVEVVCYATGKLAHRFQLLRLQQLLLAFPERIQSLGLLARKVMVERLRISYSMLAARTLSSSLCLSSSTSSHLSRTKSVTSSTR